MDARTVALRERLDALTAWVWGEIDALVDGTDQKSLTGMAVDLTAIDAKLATVDTDLTAVAADLALTDADIATITAVPAANRTDIQKAELRALRAGRRGQVAARTTLVHTRWTLTQTRQTLARARSGAQRWVKVARFAMLVAGGPRVRDTDVSESDG